MNMSYLFRNVFLDAEQLIESSVLDLFQQRRRQIHVRVYRRLTNSQLRKLSNCSF